MGILTHTFQQDASIITTTTDKYGTKKVASSEVVKCRFRYITEIEGGQNRENITDSEAIVWLEPDTAVVEGSILQVDGFYWRVNRLVKARKLSGDTVEFLKAFVKRHEMAS